MLQAALEYIAKLGQSAGTGTELELDNHRQIVVFPDGRMIDSVKDKPARAHKCDTLDSFVSIVNDRGGEGAEVWCGERSVCAVLDADEYRENTVSMGLEPSDEWMAINNLRAFDQKSLIEFLRSNFNLDTPLLKAVRRVNFKRVSDGTKTVDHGKETLGRSVESAVQAIDEIPETVIFSVSRYAMDRLRDKWAIEFRISIDMERELFLLFPGPNELVMCQQRATSGLLEILSAELTTDRIYVGKP